MFNAITRRWSAIKEWWQRQPGRERVGMTMEAAIFFATLVYVIVASGQLNVMRATLAQNQKLVEAARQSADTADRALKFSEEAEAPQLIVLNVQDDESTSLPKILVANIGHSS